GAGEQLLIAALHHEEDVRQLNGHVCRGTGRLESAEAELGRGGCEINTATQIVARPRTTKVFAPLDGFTVASLQQRELALEADRVDVGQVVAQDLNLLAES